jgi:hypothetical protein
VQFCSLEPEILCRLVHVKSVEIYQGTNVGKITAGGLGADLQTVQPQTSPSTSGGGGGGGGSSGGNGGTAQLGVSKGYSRPEQQRGVQQGKANQPNGVHFCNPFECWEFSEF